MDFKAFITLYKPEDGGRKTYIADGYRPNIKFENDEYITSAYFNFESWIAPGETKQVGVNILSQRHFIKSLYKNRSFKIQEGKRIVGIGVVCEVVNKIFEKTV